jgi:hypothetical protein
MTWASEVELQTSRGSPVSRSKPVDVDASNHGRQDDYAEPFDGAVEGAPGPLRAALERTPEVRCRRRNLCCAAACVFALFALGGSVVGSDPRMWRRHAAESDALGLILWLVSSQNRATLAHNREYFEAQRPLVEASARDFELLEYWSDMRVGSAQTDWRARDTHAPRVSSRLAAPAASPRRYPMIGLRFDMMVRSLRKDPRNDDFRVEKDKCECYRFIELNKLPIMPIIRRWTGEPAGCKAGERCPHLAADRVYDGLRAALGDPTSAITFPSFLKTCHLTQARR